MENKIDFYIRHLEECLINSEKNNSKITNELLEMEGMTGKKTRHFYNNLLNLQDCRYLEIGTWKGSSLCSAMYNNKANITCIDNFSEFAESSIIKETLLSNIDKFKGENNLTFIEQDCFLIDVSKLSKNNIYLYDGGHLYEEQYKAITHYLECMDEVFILIVDDWNWQDVRQGTIDGIQKCNLNVLWKREIRLTQNNEHTDFSEAKESWWNGMGIFVLQKLL